MKKEGLKDEHELQSYFIQRIDKFITAKERRMIGWDEIPEGGLSPNATVMSWRGTEGGIAAARQNHDAIMANIWTEYMITPEYVEYMTFPRDIAIAEVGWTSKDRKNIDDFKQRLEVHKKQLDYLNVNYFGAPINNTFQHQWPKEMAKNNSVSIRRAVFNENGPSYFLSVVQYLQRHFHTDVGAGVGRRYTRYFAKA